MATIDKINVNGVEYALYREVIDASQFKPPVTTRDESTVVTITEEYSNKSVFLDMQYYVNDEGNKARSELLIELKRGLKNFRMFFISSTEDSFFKYIAFDYQGFLIPMFTETQQLGNSDVFLCSAMLDELNGENGGFLYYETPGNEDREVVKYAFLVEVDELGICKVTPYSDMDY